VESSGGVVKVTKEIPNEIWRQVPGYEGLYEVSNIGRVRSFVYNRRYASHKGSHMLHPSNGNHGYLMVSLHGTKKHRNICVHCLVALAFIGPRPEKHDIHHLNSNPHDNRSENLCYLLESEHLKTIRPNPPKGEKSPNAKITESDVRMMRKLYESGAYAKRQLARMYGLSQKTARAVIERKSWKHVE
jgi:hypothetical protein